MKGPLRLVSMMALGLLAAILFVDRLSLIRGRPLLIRGIDPIGGEAGRIPALRLGEKGMGPFFPGLDARLLATIEDDTVFRPGEREVWFHLLSLLRKASDAELAAASLGSVSFAQLDRQSAEYRGRLATVRGTVHRVQRVEAPANDIGIEQYWQLWLQPEGEPDFPIVIYCLELPRQYPIGGEVANASQVTGFYFKRWVYLAQEGARTAPLLLARSVDWRAPPVAEKAESTAWSQTPVLVGVAASLALLAAFLLALRFRSRGPRTDRETFNVAALLAATAAKTTEQAGQGESTENFKTGEAAGSSREDEP